MPRLWHDQGEVSGPLLPEESRLALTAALLEHRTALVTLASAVCDFARELQASGSAREEILIAVRELVVEFRTLTVNALEEEGDDDVLDAMVDSRLDEWVVTR
jgi:hypothetical protein